MAPLPPLSKIVQFQLIYQGNDGTQMRNMLYFEYSQNMNPTDLGTLTNNMKNDWAANMAGHTTSNLSLLEVFANDLTSALSPQASDGLAVVPGTVTPATSSPLPFGVAMVIGNQTARKYKGGHSRNYIPGLREDGLADMNTWQTTFQATILNAWQAFLHAFVTNLVPAAVGTLTQVVPHRYGRPAGAPPDSELPSVPLADPFTDQVLAYVSDPQVGSQRRRYRQSG